MNRSSGRARTPSNSASNVRAENCPNTIWMRSAYRDEMFARAMIDRSPENSTRPFSGRTSSAPIRRSSSPKMPSMPNRQGAQYVNFSVIALSFPLPPARGTQKRRGTSSHPG